MGPVVDAVVVEEDVCKMPPVTPNQKKCKAYIEKWTYVSRQGECVPFIYGGCHGTENLFDTQAQCEARCPPLTETPRTNSLWVQPPLCQQGPMRGHKF